jgi:hypothetical protein
MGNPEFRILRGVRLRVRRYSLETWAVPGSSTAYPPSPAWRDGGGYIRTSTAPPPSPQVRRDEGVPAPEERAGQVSGGYSFNEERDEGVPAPEESTGRGPACAYYGMRCVPAPEERAGRVGSRKKNGNVSVFLSLVHSFRDTYRSNSTYPDTMMPNTTPSLA